MSIMSCTAHGLQTVPPILTVLICVTTCSTLLDSFIQEDLCVCVANFKLVHSCFVFSSFFGVTWMWIKNTDRQLADLAHCFGYYTILFWGSVVWIHCHDLWMKYTSSSHHSHHSHHSIPLFVGQNPRCWWWIEALKISWTTSSKACRP